jgi:hypothetical protein
MKLFTLMALGLIAGSGILAASDQALSKEQKDRNGGYYLLHDLLDQEADVDKIMLVKNAPPEIGHFTKTISALASESLATLDKLKSQDSTLNFDKNPLPAIEIEVRKSITDDKEHQLLFGTKGPAFVRALLVSQIQAGNYAKHLAKVLAQHESGDTRAALEKMADQWSRQVEKAYSLLESDAAH